jgi:multidrug efflux pump subunit AcrB
MRSAPGLISLGVRNPVMANLLMIFILVIGLLSANGLVRETYPEFSLDHIGIEVYYPGASAEDVEESITVRIEEAIAGTPGVVEISSSSSEEFSSVFARIETGGPSADKIVKDLEDRIAQQVTLPDDATDPIVSERLARNQVINVAVSGEASERTLKALAMDVRNDLINLPAISQVSLIGVRDYEISVDVSEHALQRYSLSFDDIRAAIAGGSLDLPGGRLRTADEEISVRFIGQRHTAAEFENIAVKSTPDGAVVRLGQIATVRDTFEETTKKGWFNGQRAAMVTVYKTPSQDTSTIARLVRQYVDNRQESLPAGLSLAVWGDSSVDVDARINMLFENGIGGILLVLISLGLFLSIRTSVWVAAGIPVSFAGAMIVLAATGQTMNMISLLGLIMVTGIIVDDAIVIAEHIHTLRGRGMNSIEAAITGCREMALPVLGSSATTIVAFIPLMFVSGTMGKFIRVLPIVVIAAIVASSLEAFAILPAHLRHMAAPAVSGGNSFGQRTRQAIDRAMTRFIDNWYRPVVQGAVQRRLLTLSGCLALVLITYGLILGGHIPFVLFPTGEANLLRARVRFPQGTPASVSEQAVHRMEEAAWTINKDSDFAAQKDGPVRKVFSSVGEWSGFWTQTGSQLCEVMVELSPSQSRTHTSTEIARAWTDRVGSIPDAQSMETVVLEPGPTEKPVEIRLHGSDLKQLERAADLVRGKLGEFEGVTAIESDLIPGKRQARVRLRPNAPVLGVTAADLATQIRSGFSGGEAVTVQRQGEEVEVQVRYPEQERQYLANLMQMRLRTGNGLEVPFNEVADLDVVRGYSSIWRQDGRRRIRVRAAIDERYANAEQILAELTAGFLPELQEQVLAEDRDTDFSYSLGGQHAQIRESMDSLAVGIAVALVGIFALLATMMRSYIQPVMIMLAIPLGGVGAVVGHWVMGFDITMMSVFGMVALSGVVVNDALVLIVQINRLVESGQDVFPAIVESGRSRFRAVVLTSLTTVAGLTPLMLEQSAQARQLIPMVISMVFGIIFATVLTLVVIPALYLAVNDLQRLTRWLHKGGEYPTAEAVAHSEEQSLIPTA